MLPSLRLELLGVRAEVIGTAVHDPGAVVDELAFADQDGRFAVWAAAGGEDGVGDGFAAVHGDDGVEAESWEYSVEQTEMNGRGSFRTFIHHCLEVFHLFELLESGSLPVESLVDFLLKLGPNVRPSCKSEPHVA